MKTSALLRLYPARWRARYGDEMAALLEDERASAGIVRDLVKGAVAAHFSSYPRTKGDTMTRTRLQLTAALLAALAVLPAAVFLAATVARGLQPVQHQPAHLADDIVHGFIALPDALAVVLLVVAPTVSLLIAAAVLVTRLRADAALRADISAFGEASMRLLRRPAPILSLLVVVASALILFFLLVHSIVG